MQFDLPDPIAELFARKAARFGMDIQDYVRVLWMKEAERLEDEERRQPKGKQVGAVGRPPVDAIVKQARGIAGQLKAVYAKLEERHPEEFKRIWGEQLEALNAAAEANDLAALTRIRDEQPWTRR